MQDTMTYTVTTVAGSRQHSVEGSAENLTVSAKLSDAFKGESNGFYLPNPATLYSLANVISVSVEGGTPRTLEEVKRRIGFNLSEGTAEK